MHVLGVLEILAGDRDPSLPAGPHGGEDEEWMEEVGWMKRRSRREDSGGGGM